ncbi:MAG: hypothetical protein JSR45_05965 [Proteobacteria bacterium]|nr:hypothetical protein [Pseudomonadota bacterium]
MVLADFRDGGQGFENTSVLTPLRLTPGEWRRILEDPTFLEDSGNAYAAPRRFHGLPVEIVRT